MLFTHVSFLVLNLSALPIWLLLLCCMRPKVMGLFYQASCPLKYLHCSAFWCLLPTFAFYTTPRTRRSILLPYACSLVLRSTVFRSIVLFTVLRSIVVLLWPPSRLGTCTFAAYNKILGFFLPFGPMLFSVRGFLVSCSSALSSSASRFLVFHFLVLSLVSRFCSLAIWSCTLRPFTFRFTAPETLHSSGFQELHCFVSLSGSPIVVLST